MKHLKPIIAILLLLHFGCAKESNTDIMVETSDFNLTIPENPSPGQVLGTITGTTNSGTVRFQLTTQNPAGAFSIDTLTGVLSVANALLFDFETRTNLTGVVKVSNGSVSKNTNLSIQLTDVPESLSVQNRLDNGETPFQIYSGNAALLDSLWGKTWQGGLIFYLNTANGSGMVAAPGDQGTLNWGCQGTNIPGTGTTIGTGAINTQLIVNGCSVPNSAARVCYNLVLNGYSDWYLPSKDELFQIHKNLKLKLLGDIATHRYWSSSQYNAQFAYCQFMNLNVNQLYYDKDLIAYPVRAVRTF